ncbi:hypothetical protein ABE10_00185 [Bacillus toyonensis]|nr:hypothetical protein [Bacillus toyonensis]
MPVRVGRTGREVHEGLDRRPRVGEGRERSRLEGNRRLPVSVPHGDRDIVVVAVGEQQRRRADRPRDPRDVDVGRREVGGSRGGDAPRAGLDDPADLSEHVVGGVVHDDRRSRDGEVDRHRSVAVVVDVVRPAGGVEDHVPVDPGLRAVLDVVDDVVGVALGGGPAPQPRTVLLTALGPVEMDVGELRLDLAERGEVLGPHRRAGDEVPQIAGVPVEGDPVDVRPRLRV